MRVYPVGLAFVTCAAVVGGGVLLAKPTDHTTRLAEPPDSGLSYTGARFTAVDARRVFAAQGIRLTVKSRTTAMTTLGDRRDLLEVDAFGDRRAVERAGFSDYTVVGLGASAHYAHFPRTCAGGAPDAERWHENIRVIVSCAKAGAGAPRWLARVDRALSRL